MATFLDASPPPLRATEHHFVCESEVGSILASRATGRALFYRPTSGRPMEYEHVIRFDVAGYKKAQQTDRMPNTVQMDDIGRFVRMPNRESYIPAVRTKP